MKGFKNSSKTQYSAGGCDEYAKGGKVRGAAKVGKVMREFKSGELHSGSKKGPKVTNPKQAVAIALSEARAAGAKIPQKPVKKRDGGAVARGNRMQELEAREEAALIREGRARARREAAEERANPRYSSEDPPSAVRETTVTREVVPARRKLPPKGSFMQEPIVRDIMRSVGLKHGGLAVKKGK